MTSHFNRRHIRMIDEMVLNNGIEETIDFYLDVIIENNFKANEYINASLEYCRIYLNEI